MNRALSAVVLLLLVGEGQGADWRVARAFESQSKHISRHPIDVRVMAVLRRHRIEPARRCTDAVFLRRVYLDVLGTLPEPEAAREFLRDRRPGKRTRLIDAVLKHEGFADYGSLKWCDVLRVKAEFPINLWPNAVQAYHRWIRDAIRNRMPYDQFARALLTSSGSNFRVAPVNFYRAIQGHEPSAIAEAVALTLMGSRLDTWPKDRREGMAALFSRVAYKGTAEWKEEIVFLNPAPADALEAMLPDGTKVRVEPGQDPRRAFADWLISPGNPWFARSVVNRIWAWLMSRGIIHEPDDIRPDNTPVHPELLAYLEKELVRAKYDLRHIYRLILTSNTYQQSSIPRSKHPKAEALFAYYGVRQLDAEVLIDALCWIGQDGEGYSSVIPEPFTFIPDDQRTIELADGSISSQFLEMFGRPSRDTGFESERNNHPNGAQRLHLLNSTHVQRKIERSGRLRKLLRAARGKPRAVIVWLYLTLLSREPLGKELAISEKYFETAGLRNGTVDLTWALMNSKEFLYKH